MPYQWTTNAAPDHSGAVFHELRLWPHRSLPRRGFAWFIGVTAALLLVPLLAVLGTAVLWGVLPFAALAVAGVWFAIHKTYESGRILEELRLDPRTFSVRRFDPGHPVREWRTNSYWVRPALRKGPVEAYLTVTDGQREIELGAFLTPDERRSLCAELTRILGQVRG